MRRAKRIMCVGACACVVKLSMVSISLFGINISGIDPLIEYLPDYPPRLKR